MRETRRCPLAPPSHDEVYVTLMRVSALLGMFRCFHFAGRYHFAMGGGWTLAVTPESARRFRFDACIRGDAAATVWSLAGDDERTTRQVLELADDIRASEWRPRLARPGEVT